MYAKFFGLQQEPFSIAPDPRYLFMSERHREALAHLLYGLRGGGGFVLLTGEIGAGKTTVCRCFLEQIPAHCNVAYIFNPKLTVSELLQTVCEEYGVAHPPAATATVKQYVDALNEFLLRTHAAGRNNVLIIDEAQNLSAEVLEQLRLLTNLETHERKLLQIILIGQPELRQMLARPELEQLAQRVIARFHLEALSEVESEQYVHHRMEVAGFTGALPFDRSARRRIHQLARGVPRRINLLCDRALLGAYAQGRRKVDRKTVDQAAAEVFDRGELRPAPAERRRRLAWAGGAVAVLGAATVFALSQRAPAERSRVAGAPALAASAASAPAPRVEPAVEPLAAITLGQRSEGDAWHDLALAWRLSADEAAPLAEADPCKALERLPGAALRCFRSDEGLALLRLLGRPAVLTLRDADNQPFYALLVGLDADRATLRAGTATQTVSLLGLSRQWRGEFATLWRVPPEYQGKVGAGAGVQWLDAQLAKAFGEPAVPVSGRYDAALQARVATFQRSQGLKSDGLAGPITLMQLNRAAGVEEPRLARSHAATTN